MAYINILEFIATIRDSFEGSVEVYTQGSCYKFYLILKEVFPEAIAYYDVNHVITKIGDEFYDITGIVKCENHVPMHDNFPDSKLYEKEHKISRDMFYVCNKQGVLEHNKIMYKMIGINDKEIEKLILRDDEKLEEGLYSI